MFSNIRSAFGIGGGLGSGNAKSEKSTDNAVFLQTQLQPILDKLVKELRGRLRLKEESHDFQRALKALKAFEKEEWPPQKKRSTTSSATKAASGATTKRSDDDAYRHHDHHHHPEQNHHSSTDTVTTVSTTQSHETSATTTSQPETSTTFPVISEENGPTQKYDQPDGVDEDDEFGDFSKNDTVAAETSPVTAMENVGSVVDANDTDLNKSSSAEKNEKDTTTAPLSAEEKDEDHVVHDDDFGDFAGAEMDETHAEEIPADGTKDEIDDNRDDFGDFAEAGESENATTAPQASPAENDDDDFGDFAGADEGENADQTPSSPAEKDNNTANDDACCADAPDNEENDDDDFGDFAGVEDSENADEPPSAAEEDNNIANDDVADFGEFEAAATNGEDDDSFGDFAAAEKSEDHAAPVTNETEKPDDDDDFGDFAAATELEDKATPVEKDNGDDGFGDFEGAFNEPVSASSAEPTTTKKQTPEPQAPAASSAMQEEKKVSQVQRPKASVTRLPFLPVDSQTMEEIHPAIIDLLEAFIEILESNYKTTRASELVLDAITLLVNKRYVSGRAGCQDLGNQAGSSAFSGQHSFDGMSATASDDEESSKAPSILQRVMETVATCSDQNIESIQIALVKCMKAILTSPKCGVHEASMLLALRSVFHVFLVTKSNACKELARSALQDMLRSVMGRMETYDPIVKSNQRNMQQQQQNVAQQNAVLLDAEQAKLQQADNDSVHSGSTSAPSFASQYHADAYALFRSLCKMSSKELPAENESETERPSFFSLQTQTDPMSLHGKVLSLELILAALDLSGDAFCEGERFVYLVQNYLCVSLLKNCVSNHVQVAYLSQKIFLLLVVKFKAYLKQEIEVFMSNVFLRVLESKNSSFKQKALVLESLRSVCSDPTLLAQIFLNYDCDFEGKNLYKDIVQVVTKFGSKATSMPSSKLGTKEAEQEFELSLAGLEVLMSILRAFLKALKLPGGEDDYDEDSASARIRGMLQLDVGLAAIKQPPLQRKDSVDSLHISSSSLNEPRSSNSRGQSPTQMTGNTANNSNKQSNPSEGDTGKKIVDAFELKRNAEQNFEIGSVKFSLSLSQGLKFFIEHGLVECNARSIAQFFLTNKDKLDKTQMGEALGREPFAAFVKGSHAGEVDVESGGTGFWVRILHHYVHAFDFTDLMFDDAIRLFLSGFRLPGEAQKIDRIMEKFAERFTAQNPEVFPSADTAFILAFSVIMLNTDLHNPSIKPEKRMTQQGFVRNNRGIGENGGDLPEKFLIGIFNRIKESPFSLKEDDAARERAQNQVSEAVVFFDSASLFGTTAEERRRERFKKERDEMMAATQQLVRRRTDRKTAANRGSTVTSNMAKTVDPADVVKPMFDVTWGAMLGILSQVLECNDDERTVALCLNGFVYAVRISAHSQMSLARDTFVSSLAKFTFLGSLKEMKRKNVESIRTLLSIAVIDGEHLGDSWSPVLQCISQIARMRLTASGLDSDEKFLMTESQQRKGQLTTPSKLQDAAKETEENNAQAVLEAVQEVLIDRVFSSTARLSAKSLAHFIEQLITVSNLEIEGKARGGITGVESSSMANGETSSNSTGDGTSLYSLQRLVDVATYNMEVRPRLVWSPIWHVMADYFAKIACHENLMVSVFAIDSLKQLSLKFLDKPELAEFNFQRIFLRPFFVVMEDEGSTVDNREMVLRCVDNIVRAKAHNFQSGWKVVFSILRKSATDPSNKIDYLGLSILQHLLDEHLHELCRSDSSTDLDSQISDRARNGNADDFVSLVKASLEFVDLGESDAPRTISLSMRALSHTAIYADLLADQRVQPPVSGAQWDDRDAPGYTYKGLTESEALEMVLWRTIFEGLADGIRCSARSSAGGVGCLLQRGSVIALRSILLRHGHLFSTAQWAAILEQTYLPSIMDGSKHDVSPVVSMLSECPYISSIDFLVDALPMPPPPDDESLLQFKKMQNSLTRSLGDAEVMCEASFTDLRYFGDGDLRKACSLAKKVSESFSKLEQPFPDSWVVTTAPIALGLLTDIACDVVVKRGPEGRRRLWPIILKQYKSWCVGMPFTGYRQGNEYWSWRPCEALVRIACREIHRLTERMDAYSRKQDTDFSGWPETLITCFTELVSESVEREHQSIKELIISKNKALLERRGPHTEGFLHNGSEEVITTPYGVGIVKDWKKNRFEGPVRGTSIEVMTKVISLEFGGILYLPQSTKSYRLPSKGAALGVPAEVTVPGAYWERIVPELKIRCVAAHLLHQSLLGVLDRYATSSSQTTLSPLLKILNTSRSVAEDAVKDSDVATAFQEAMVSDWGDGVEEVEQALETASRLSHVQGSAVFFLAQEAGATQAIVRLLSLLYCGSSQSSWDGERFSEAPLLNIVSVAMQKFLDSEERDGHLIDPNVWRNASESGGKVALYCTSFAAVVVDSLKMIRSLRTDQFLKQKQRYFPMLCNLVRVQSEEIRHVVQEILCSHVANAIGVHVAFET